MLSKTQSISVRLSQEDYSYLMKIDRNGAVTQSEKVRELIALARDAVGTESYSRAYMASAESLLPFKALYKESPEKRSALVESLFELIVDTVATIQTTAQTSDFNTYLESSMIPVLESFVAQLNAIREGHGEIINPKSMQKLLSLLGK